MYDIRYTMSDIHRNNVRCRMRDVVRSVNPIFQIRWVRNDSEQLPKDKTNNTSENQSLYFCTIGQSNIHYCPRLSSHSL